MFDSSFFVKIFKFYLYVQKCLHACVIVYCVCLVPKEGRRGHETPGLELQTVVRNKLELSLNRCSSPELSLQLPSLLLETVDMPSPLVEILRSPIPAS